MTQAHKTIRPAPFQDAKWPSHVRCTCCGNQVEIIADGWNVPHGECQECCALVDHVEPDGTVSMATGRALSVTELMIDLRPDMPW